MGRAISMSEFNGTTVRVIKSIETLLELTLERINTLPGRGGCSLLVIAASMELHLYGQAGSKVPAHVEVRAWPEAPE